MADERATIEANISGPTWGVAEPLRAAVARWIEFAAGESAGLEISAVPFAHDWISVRVTRTGTRHGYQEDCIEFGVPVSYIEPADQRGLDHFVARRLDESASALRGRPVGMLAVYQLPPLPAPTRREPEPEETTMARTASKTNAKPEAAPRKASAPAAKPGAAAKPRSAGGRPRKASAPAVAAVAPAEEKAPRRPRKAAAPAVAAKSKSRAAAPPRAEMRGAPAAPAMPQPAAGRPRKAPAGSPAVAPAVEGPKPAPARKRRAR